MTYLGTRLKYLRKLEKITQQQLATSLGIAKSTISMYENGQREPDFETLEAIADYFNVDMRTFFPNDRDASPIKAGFSRDEEYLLSCFRGMNKEGRDKLLEYTDDLFSLPKYRKNV